MKVFNFIEAVTTLPARLSDDQLCPVFRVIGSNFRGQLEATFVILKDDDHDRLLLKLRETDQRTRSGPYRVTSALTFSGVVRQEGSGMELEAGLTAALRQPPPPPPPLPPCRHPVESPSVHGSPRAQRRSRTTPPRRSKKSKRHRSPSSSPPRSRRHRRSPSASSSSSCSTPTSHES